MQRPICRSGIDRAQILATPRNNRRLPDFEGFRRLRDFFVRSQTNIKTYARVAEYADVQTEVRLFLQHDPKLSTLPPFKVTLVPQGKRLLDPDVLERIVDRFQSYRFSLVEVVTDCSRQSVIDLAFVRQHALFGKSRPARSGTYMNSSFWGCRKDGKYVRCYEKTELNAFRIELEIHSQLLRRWHVQTLRDLTKLPDLVCPSHMRFVRVNFERLRQHLVRRGSDADAIIRRLSVHRNSIHQAMQFLRTDAGVHNAHRFLVTMALTDEVHRSLRIWARHFQSI